MSKSALQAVTAAEAFLTRLGEHGVEYLFGNAGTDFPSIIEAFCQAFENGRKVPTPVTVPHENLAVALAYGYYQATGRPQAVMLHVNVGTANAICGLLNAAREDVPILLFAGRTPITEEDNLGARSVFIHWGQEMFDQAGMLRETVKWDYELRTPSHVAEVVDRDIGIAMSEPRGPIYVTLPREVLAKTMKKIPRPIESITTPAPPAPDPAALDQLADWVRESEFPIIIAGGYGSRKGEADNMAALTEKHVIPVIAYRPRHSPVVTDHPMHIGFEVGQHVKDADLIMVVDCDVPWMPKLHQPNPDAKVVLIGPDPLYSDYVMRSFPCHLGITGKSSSVLGALDRALDAKGLSPSAKNRQTRVQQIKSEAMEAANLQLSTAANSRLSTTPWIASCLNDAKLTNDLIVTEMVFPMQFLDFPEPRCHFGLSPAGGLGWGLGEAIGLKLANPDRRVIAIVGDGSYMLGNPTPSHYVSEALGLPFLTIIVNNSMWAAVRRATLSMYPEGAAAKSNTPPLTHLTPSPHFERIVEASGGYAEKVETASELPATLERALNVLENERRQAVLNVITEYADATAIADAKR